MWFQPVVLMSRLKVKLRMRSKAEKGVSVSDFFLEKKARGSTPPTVVSEASTAREIRAQGTGCTMMGTAERMSHAWWKAASRGGVQPNSLPGTLRALVRVARIKAAFLINFL